MSLTIAVAGKGGTGKTTLCALVIRHLLARGRKPILAVDADPNANLAEALGLAVPATIGDILDETLHQPEPLPGGMSKDAYIEYRLNAALAEGQDVDLLVMGRPEGPGCYCFANNVLRGHLAAKAQNYPLVVMDNEAGLEHLSRRTTNNVDLLLVTSDATVRGLRSAARVRELIDELGLAVKRRYLVVTKAPAGQPLAGILQEQVAATGLELAGVIPYDPLVAEFDVQARPLVDLPAAAVSVQAAEDLFARVMAAV